MSGSKLSLADIDLDRLEETVSGLDAEVSEVGSWKTASRARAVAIIGMDGKAGAAENLQQFWDLLIHEQEGVRELPEQRRADVKRFLISKGIHPPSVDNLYVRSAYLTDIAGFDYSFFGLSQQEAKYMDPHQRIFLETAWKALEDSGYGGERIRGSDTGVFVGFSSDFGADYRSLIQSSAYEAPEIAVAGNVKSMIAGRLSYHLNLRGPALLIDTACSSGLMAMYQAVQAIRNGECSMAVAGAVNCNALPIMENGRIGIGVIDIQNINSSAYHTRTFDDACDGTYAAEGSFAFVLKPLDQALQDGDTVRAVIRGGASTQDGASNGITAPNSEAQEELIIRALADAGISAEELSYIEAHGTATPLGDPIEIDGIQRAFRHFTARKQFCAIGSLKSNIGHLDNAAGLGGVAKVVLAMEQRTLPASLNFRVPNRNIPFVESHVYVNDRTAAWEPEFDETLKAGINSFGLSGTNCHLILESAPARTARQEVSTTGPLLLPLSAKTPTALRKLAEAYLERLPSFADGLTAAAFTASCGRMHHRVRLAILFKSEQELRAGLEAYIRDGSAAGHPGLRCGRDRLAADEDERRQEGEMTAANRQRLEEEAATLAGAGYERWSLQDASRCADLYVTGIRIPWERLFRRWSEGRIPLPTYPFEHRRCWVDPAAKGEEERLSGGHPLLGGQFSRTIGHTLYRHRLQPENYWELAEHKVFGTSLLPGTAFVEMMVAYAKQHASAREASAGGLRFTDILFLRPFMIKDGGHKELHMLVETGGDRLRYQFASLGEDEEDWVLHAEATLHTSSGSNPGPGSSRTDLDRLRAECSHRLDISASDDLARGLTLGKRWADSVAGAWSGPDRDRLLAELALPEAYRSETDSYYLHPALLDVAVNAANNLMEEDELYLPLSYGELSIYRRLPGRFMVHIQLRGGSKSSGVRKFDISLYDPEGNAVADIKNYCIKAASEALKTESSEPYGLKPVRRIYPAPPKRELPEGAILIAGRTNEASRRIAQSFRDQGRIVIEACPSMEDGWERELLAAADAGPWALVIFTWAPLPVRADAIEPDAWREETEEAVMQGFRFLKAWSAGRYKSAAGIAALTHSRWKGGQEEAEVHPGQAALGGLWRIGALEFEFSCLRCLDEDGQTPAEILQHELAHTDRPDFLEYRDGQAFVPDMEPAEFAAPLTEPALNEDGVYLISGGTGELGTEVAKLLLRRGARRIALLGHQPIPAKEEWVRRLEDKPDARLQDRLKAWMELDRQLEALEVCAVQIEDYDELAGYLSGLRARHGRIAGVLHLAGRAGDGYLLLKEEQTFKEVYSPKAKGAVHLHLATWPDQPEMFILFSSISSLLHYPGQSDYTAANLFLDSLAEHRRQSGLPALSLQWPAWREIGMARRMGAVDEAEKYAPLHTEEALQLMDRVLGSLETLPSVLMPGRSRPKAEPATLKRTADAGAAPAAERAVLLGLAEPGEIELAVADIWSATLGLTELDADDAFSDLGGNSLLASHMLREYDKRFPGVMDIADLFTYTTVREQADYVTSRLHRPEPKRLPEPNGKANAQQAAQALDALDDMDAILEQVAAGKMTVDESSSLLSAMERGKKR